MGRAQIVGKGHLYGTRGAWIKVALLGGGKVDARVRSWEVVQFRRWSNSVGADGRL